MRNAIIGSVVIGLTAAMPLTTIADEDYQWYVNPSLGYMVTDPERDLADETAAASLGIERRKGDWGVEVKGTVASPDDESGLVKDDADIRQYSIDVLRYIPINSRIEPYVAIGAGHGDYQHDSRDDNGETQGNIGVGLRYNLTEKVSVRTDVRGIYGFDNETIDGLASVGLSLALGKTRPLATGGANAPVPTKGDADQDGVANALDSCPDTPYRVAVDASGCPLDGDKDGVPNYRDRCPETAADVRVDNRGCEYTEAATEQVELKVYFAFDSAQVGQGYISELELVSQFMDKYSTTKVTLEGHADKQGADGYNQGLSERRAEAVKAILTGNYGIDGGRISTVGFGENRPAASNDTAAGRAQNRRVEGVIRIRAN